MAEQQLRNAMYIEIKGMNKYLTDSYLNLLSTKAVIANTHPSYRERWQWLYDRTQ